MTSGGRAGISLGLHTKCAPTSRSSPPPNGSDSHWDFEARLPRNLLVRSSPTPDRSPPSPARHSRARGIPPNRVRALPRGFAQPSRPVFPAVARSVRRRAAQDWERCQSARSNSTTHRVAGPRHPRGFPAALECLHGERRTASVCLDDTVGDLQTNGQTNRVGSDAPRMRGLARPPLDPAQ